MTDNFKLNKINELNYKTKSRSLFFAYVLCISFGWLGLHRFYLKNYFFGFLYLFCFVLAAQGANTYACTVYIALWIYDFVFLKSIVNKHNINLLKTLS